MSARGLCIDLEATWQDYQASTGKLKNDYGERVWFPHHETPVVEPAGLVGRRANETFRPPSASVSILPEIQGAPWQPPAVPYVPPQPKPELLGTGQMGDPEFEPPREPVEDEFERMKREVMGEMGFPANPVRPIRPRPSSPGMPMIIEDDGEPF